MLEREVDGIVRIRPISPAGCSAATPRCRSWSTAPTPTRAHHPGLRAGRDRRSGARAAPREGEAIAGGPVIAVEPAVVQRGQRQPLLPRARPDRAGHDADRRVPHRAGHGARVGARHARGAVRHAGARRRDPARQDDPVFRARHDRPGAVHPRGASSCSTCRCAARCWC